MFRRSISLASASLLLGAVLAGCGGPQAPAMTAARAAAAKLGAKSLNLRDIDAIIQAAAREHSPVVGAGVPAVLKAPSDMAAQRALDVLYGSVVDRAVPEIDGQVDEELNVNVIGQYKKQFPEVSKPEVAAYVQGIADRLAKAAKVKPFKVTVMDVPMVNAFNAGGHAMVLFTPLVTESKDEAELAGVMAHEMAHGLARHAVKGWVADYAALAAAGAVAATHQVPAEEDALATAYVLTLPVSQQHDQDFVLSHLQGKVGDAAMTNLQFGLNSNFTQLARGRAMEAESDRLGVRMLAAAGYDPHGLVRVFERWNAHADGDTRYYSHPALGTRAGTLKQQIVAEGLKGEDRGEERHKQIVNVINPPAIAKGAMPMADRIAGAGCFAGKPLVSWRKAK